MYEITPPPYPGAFIALAQLHRVMEETHDWCLEESRSIQDSGHYKAFKELNQLNRLPSVEQLSVSCISDLFYIWKFLRQYREVYDQVIRTFEGDWLGEVAVGRRADVLNKITFVLNNSGVSAEVRAAKVLEENEAQRLAGNQMRRRLDSLSSLAKTQLREASNKSAQWWEEGFNPEGVEDGDKEKGD